jgi:hypothetical protein
MINRRNVQVQIVMKPDAREFCEGIEVGDKLEAEGEQRQEHLFLASEVSASNR